VIGQGERIEALGRRRIDEIVDPTEAVQEAELGMDVEVGEVVRAIVTGSYGRPDDPRAGWPTLACRVIEHGIARRNILLPGIDPRVTRDLPSSSRSTCLARHPSLRCA